MKKNAGFTLIEIIVTVILLGIMAAVGSMLIAQGAKGYIRAKANDELSQKVQLALDRMILEFEDISAISTLSEADPDYICYTSTYYNASTGNTTNVSRCIGRVGSQIKILNGTTPPAAGTGSALIDNVNSFQLDFYSFTDPFTGSGTWSTVSPIANLASIKITLTLNRTDVTGGTYTCSTVYNVRRNNSRVGRDYYEPLNWNQD
ncbi:MAG: type II secretion system protein [Smithellaceae bacterium]|jgi:prepilin-type N-terminal cleavage/methylation domain-containing protein